MYSGLPNEVCKKVEREKWVAFFFYVIRICESYILTVEFGMNYIGNLIKKDDLATGHVENYRSIFPIHPAVEPDISE